MVPNIVYGEVIGRMYFVNANSTTERSVIVARVPCERSEAPERARDWLAMNPQLSAHGVHWTFELKEAVDAAPSAGPGLAA